MYRIIYIWKILEKKVPNCGVELKEPNERLGRLCALPALNKKAPEKVKTLRENSFQVQAPKLFNSLPKKLREKTNCSVEEFKEDLDKFLEKIPDEPKVSGGKYIPGACDIFSGQASNSVIDQIRKMKNEKWWNKFD